MMMSELRKFEPFSWFSSFIQTLNFLTRYLVTGFKIYLHKSLGWKRDRLWELRILHFCEKILQYQNEDLTIKSGRKVFWVLISRFILFFISIWLDFLWFSRKNCTILDNILVIYINRLNRLYKSIDYRLTNKKVRKIELKKKLSFYVHYRG